MAEALRLFPRIGTNMTLGSLRAMVSDFVILDRRVDGSMRDLSRTMIEHASKFKEYFFLATLQTLAFGCVDNTSQLFELGLDCRR